MEVDTPLLQGNVIGGKVSKAGNLVRNHIIHRFAEGSTMSTTDDIRREAQQGAPKSHAKVTQALTEEQHGDPHEIAPRRTASSRRDTMTDPRDTCVAALRTLASFPLEDFGMEETMDPRDRAVAALRAVVLTYDAYRSRGVAPAPAEYADVVRAIDAARAALAAVDAEPPTAQPGTVAQPARQPLTESEINALPEAQG